MDAQAILNKIEQDAQETAERIRSEAKEKAKTLELESQTRISDLEKTMLAHAENDCEQMEERMQRMADLDNRKVLLAKKRDVIDEAFTMAKDKLMATAASERREFYLRQTIRNAKGNETLIIGADGSDWYDDAFVNDVNKALKDSGKSAELELQKEFRQEYTGIVLSHNGAEIRITFDTLLDEARADMEQKAAQLLFSK